MPGSMGRKWPGNPPKPRISASVQKSQQCVHFFATSILPSRAFHIVTVSTGISRGLLETVTTNKRKVKRMKTGTNKKAAGKPVDEIRAATAQLAGLRQS